MTTRKANTSWLKQYGAWILAGALGLFLLFDRFAGDMPSLDAVSGAVQSNLTVATFVENMLYVLVALALVVAILRFFDRQILGVSFTVWHSKIKTNAIACSIYTGLRFLAICVLIGLLLS